MLWHLFALVLHRPEPAFPFVPNRHRLRPPRIEFVGIIQAHCRMAVAVRFDIEAIKYREPLSPGFACFRFDGIVADLDKYSFLSRQTLGSMVHDT